MRRNLVGLRYLVLTTTTLLQCMSIILYLLGATYVYSQTTDPSSITSTSSTNTTSLLPLPNIRIMPLGDSLTVGEYDAVNEKPYHYRKKLYKNLSLQEYNISFVGSSVKNMFMKSPHHEGHEGWTITKFQQHIQEFLDRSDPDIILVMIGTADMELAKNKNDVEDAIDQWDELIQTIMTLRPFSYIIASNLPPHTQPWLVGDQVNTNIDDFNSNIESLVNDYSFDGKRISFLDMHTTLSQVPNTKNVIYNQMGIAWSLSIQKIMGINGDGLRPGVLRIRGGLDRRHIIITFTKPIEDVKMAKKINFEINGGLELWSGSVDSNDNRSIILRASTLHVPGKEYVVTILKGATNTPDQPNNHMSISKSRINIEHVSISFVSGWRFLAITDLHLAEKYIFGRSPAEEENDVKIIQYLKKFYGGDFVTISGDTNAGFWDRPSFREQLSDTLQRYLTPEETVLKAGDMCYSGLLASFRKGGYWNLMMAYGDHEAGDNRWLRDSLKSHLQPQFRQTFSKNFNFDYDGNFKYDMPIGNVQSHPIGTDFEFSSYAYKHENVLFVTVDVLYQKSPLNVIGDAGTVTGMVTGEQLEWLNQVLGEGRKDPTVRHIFVQGHFPVLYPVRKAKSSGMYMDDETRSEFWNVMRNHSVDIYFSGEVHQNTVLKDPESDLIQIASRGNYFSDFLSVDVTHTTIDITCHREFGPKKTMYNYQHKRCGRLLLEKDDDQTLISVAWGELTVLNKTNPVIHFSFDHVVDLWSRPVVGLGDVLRGEKKKPIVAAFEVSGVTCHYSLPNMGEFGQNYDAQASKLTLVEGINGNAAKFTTRSRAAVWGMGPHSGEKPVSYALWFRTTSTKDALLVVFEGYWPKKEVMNLRLLDGHPELSYSATQKIRPLGTVVKNLNDGDWHHIAVSTFEDCLLSEIKFFVDGKAVLTSVIGSDDHVSFPNSGQISLGGFGHGRSAFGNYERDGFTNGDRFVGAMDEFFVWARSISFNEVQVLTEPLETL